MNYFSSNFKLGILGGGQLGKMILYNTRKFDVHTCVLDPSKDAPARLACDEFFVGVAKCGSRSESIRYVVSDAASGRAGELFQATMVTRRAKGLANH